MNYTQRRLELLEHITDQHNASDITRIPNNYYEQIKTLLTTSIAQAVAEERARVVGIIRDKRKEVIITKRVTRNLGQGNYSTLEDGADIFIRNPIMTENEQEQGIGYNQAIDDLLSSLEIINPKE